MMEEEARSFLMQFANMLFALGVVIVLLFVASWAIRRFMNSRIQYGNQTSQIRIIECRPLSQRSHLYLIEVDNRRILLGESASGLEKIVEIDKEKS